MFAVSEALDCNLTLIEATWTSYQICNLRLYIYRWFGLAYKPKCDLSKNPTQKTMN